MLLLMLWCSWWCSLSARTLRGKRTHRKIRYSFKVWSDRAKDRTFHAISKGVLNDPRYFKRLGDIILVNEPEAAATYTLRSLIQQEDDDFIGVSLFIRLLLVHRH